MPDEKPKKKDIKRLYVAGELHAKLKGKAGLQRLTIEEATAEAISDWISKESSKV